jgi:hypothetical protein
VKLAVPPLKVELEMLVLPLMVDIPGPVTTYSIISFVTEKASLWPPETGTATLTDARLDGELGLGPLQFHRAKEDIQRTMDKIDRVFFFISFLLISL